MRTAGIRLGIFGYVALALLLLVNAGYQISKDAEKSSKHDIDKAINEATKDIDTESLKGLE